MPSIRIEHGAHQCSALALTTKLASDLCWQRAMKGGGLSAGPRAADPVIVLVPRGPIKVMRLSVNHYFVGGRQGAVGRKPYELWTLHTQRPLSISPAPASVGLGLRCN
jgi:hypothetical protein